MSRPLLGLVVLLVILGILAVMIAAATWRAQRRDRRVQATPIDTSPLVPMPEPMVLARADSGLLNADHEKLATAALRLDELGHPQATAYLLHALRRAPHRADELVPRLVARTPAELGREQRLVEALPDGLAHRVRGGTGPAGGS